MKIYPVYICQKPKDSRMRQYKLKPQEVEAYQKYYPLRDDLWEMEKRGFLARKPLKGCQFRGGDYSAQRHFDKVMTAFTRKWKKTDDYSGDPVLLVRLAAERLKQGKKCTGFLLYCYEKPSLASRLKKVVTAGDDGKETYFFWDDDYAELWNELQEKMK